MLRSELQDSVLNSLNQLVLLLITEEKTEVMNLYKETKRDSLPISANWPWSHWPLENSRRVQLATVLNSNKMQSKIPKERSWLSHKREEEKRLLPLPNLNNSKRLRSIELLESNKPTKDTRDLEKRRREKRKKRKNNEEISLSPKK